MLSRWLIHKVRTSTPYKKFDLIEIDEQVKIDKNIKSYLCKLLLTARIDPKMLLAAAKRVGWKKTESLLVHPSLPAKPRKRRGDFGEILTNAILVELMGYIIPVQKLRFTRARVFFGDVFCGVKIANGE